MKKLFLSLLLFLSLSIYSQEYKAKIEKLKEEAKTNNKDTEKIAKELSELNDMVNTNYIDSTQTIIYNFKTKKYIKSNVKPEVGEPLVFRIININRLAYEVNIQSDDIAIADEYFKEDIENVLKNKDTTSKDNKPIQNKEIKEPIISDDSRKTVSKKYSEPDKKLIESLEESINGAKADLRKIVEDKITVENKIKELTSKLENLKKEDKDTEGIKANQEALDEKIKEVKIINDKVNSLETEINKNITTLVKLKDVAEAVSVTFSVLMESYNNIVLQSQQMQLIEEDYQNYRRLALNPLLENDLYSTISAKEEFVLNKLFNFRSRIDHFNSSIINFYNFYNQSMNDWMIFDELKNDAKENLRTKYELIKNEVDKIKTKVDDLNLLSKLRKIEAIHAVLIKEDAYEMVSSPIQPLEDYVTFDVKIRHRDATKLSEYDDNREFKYIEYTQGGVRFDFSTGVVFNFGGNNDKYELRNVENNRKKIVITDNNEFTPTLAGMFHTSFRRSGIWAFGLTLGASINVETFQLNSLFPGVSVLIGKKQKFIISAGPAFRQVEELKANFKENEIFDSSEFNDDTELTSSQFKIGFFFGVTYNLTQKQRAKFKIGSN